MTYMYMYMYMYMYHVYSNGIQAINFNFHVIFWFATLFEKSQNSIIFLVLKLDFAFYQHKHSNLRKHIWKIILLVFKQKNI